MKSYVPFILAAAVAVSACGRSEREQEQEQAAQTAEQAAEEAAQSLEAAAKQLAALAGGEDSGDTQPVEPVSFRDLQTVFPELDGWQRGKPTGERMSAPFPYSVAEVDYTKDEGRIELKISDSGFNQLLVAPYAMFLQAGYERETADGYEKSATVNGQPGWEKWNSEGKYGEVNALVGKRFIVTIEGSGVQDVSALHALANRIDMTKLAALK